METQALIADLNRAYGMELTDDLRPDQLESRLADIVNSMITDDFSVLVQLLYRVDVSESRLRDLLKENTDTDAGRLIARLILERQWQKILTRRKYSGGNAPGADWL